MATTTWTGSLPSSIRKNVFRTFADEAVASQIGGNAVCRWVMVREGAVIRVIVCDHDGHGQRHWLACPDSRLIQRDWGGRH